MWGTTKGAKIFFEGGIFSRFSLHIKQRQKKEKERMKHEKTKKQQAYNELLQIIARAQESILIKGTEFSQEKYDRYTKVAVLCMELFKSELAKANITIDEVTNNKPYFGTTVYTDVFEVNAENKDKFVELINLADEAIFYGDEENWFHMTFYINNIWEEKNERNENNVY